MLSTVFRLIILILVVQVNGEVKIWAMVCQVSIRMILQIFGVEIVLLHLLFMDIVVVTVLS